MHRSVETGLPEEVQERCYFFNSFFYKKLAERQKAKRGGAKAGGDDCDGDTDDRQALLFLRSSRWQILVVRCVPP